VSFPLIEGDTVTGFKLVHQKKKYRRAVSGVSLGFFIWGDTTGALG